MNHLQAITLFGLCAAALTATTATAQSRYATHSRSVASGEGAAYARMHARSSHYDMGGGAHRLMTSGYNNLSATVFDRTEGVTTSYSMIRDYTQGSLSSRTQGSVSIRLAGTTFLSRRLTPNTTESTSTVSTKLLTREYKHYGTWFYFRVTVSVRGGSSFTVEPVTRSGRQEISMHARIRNYATGYSSFRLIASFTVYQYSSLQFGYNTMSVEQYASSGWQYGLLEWDLSPVRLILRFTRNATSVWREFMNTTAPADQYRKLFT